MFESHRRSRRDCSYPSVFLCARPYVYASMRILFHSIMWDKNSMIVNLFFTVYFVQAFEWVISNIVRLHTCISLYQWAYSLPWNSVTFLFVLDLSHVKLILDGHTDSRKFGRIVALSTDNMVMRDHVKVIPEMPAKILKQNNDSIYCWIALVL